MGNCLTCCKGESVVTTEDAEFMQFRGQKDVKYLEVWRTKFGFNGKLSVDSCSALVKDIRAKGRGNQKTDKQHGLPPNMLPLEQEAGENLDTFPMIQVPNPNPDGGMF